MKSPKCFTHLVQQEQLMLQKKNNAKDEYFSNQWKKFYEDLPTLSDSTIPRNCLYDSSTITQQIHEFGDTFNLTKKSCCPTKNYYSPKTFCKKNLVKYYYLVNCKKKFENRFWKFWFLKIDLKISREFPFNSIHFYTDSQITLGFLDSHRSRWSIEIGILC